MVTVAAGIAWQPRPGECICGDRIGLWQDGESTLVAVIDGLGSGQAAAAAAEAALACVEANRDQALVEILARCHLAVQATRGVVMALVRIDHRCAGLSFVGVGNIGFNAASAKPMRPVSRNGLLGRRLPTVQEYRFDCTPGDLIVLYSDGISSRFVLQGGMSALSWAPPQQLAQRIMKRYAQDDDVAVAVLVVAEAADPSPTGVASFRHSQAGVENAQEKSTGR